MTIPTRRPQKRSGAASTAATPAAPAPSTTSFWRSSSDLDGAFEHHLVDEPDLGHQRLDDATRQPARLLDRDAFGERRRCGWRTRIFTAQQAVHRRVERRLHADDLDLGVERLGGDGDPGNQPAAADRHDQRIEIGSAGEQLEADRPLAGDDIGIVIGMDQHEPPLAGERVGRLAGGAEAVAPQHHGGAERLGAIDLDEGCALGHHDRRRDPEPAGMIGDALGMVARGHRNDPGALSRKR